MSKPIFDSYGAFRVDDIFKKLFLSENHFKRKQEEAAQRIVDHILRHCDGSQHFPKITNIVDFGCGDGSLLNEIRRALELEIANINTKNKEGKNEQVKIDEWEVDYLGVDPCSKMVQLANDNYSKKGIQFVKIENDGLLNGISQDDWSSTAFLCLGHTWFHILNQKALLDQIKQKRPALLLVDVFQSWDDVVGRLLIEEINSEEGESSITIDDQKLDLLPVLEQEETRVFDDNDGSRWEYYLRTQVIKGEFDGCKHVVRGIYKKTCAGKEGHWVFATRQVAKPTNNLRPKPAKKRDTNDKTDEEVSIDTICKIAKLGEITGEDKCNYIVLREFEHVSGWGNMHCIAFAALSVEGKALNEAYFQAVNGLVNNLFVSESNANAPSIAGLRAIISIFGRGEVAVILPFDPLCTFARMVPLFKEQETAKEGGYDAELCLLPISTVDLVVEHPNWWQQRFPTGYGLFHAMLDLVSSPVGFPLSRVQGYEESYVDKAYENLETQLLNASLKKGNDGSSYFIIPFYSGSLPLFSLILEEPSTLPANATNGLLYFSLAQNLDRHLQVIINETSLRGRVIAPFMNSAWHRLKKQGQDAIKDSTPLANFAERFVTAMKSKPWKSWVRTLPSHRLISLDGIASENEKLEKIATQECKRITKDAFTQISYWYEYGEFFSDQPDLSMHDDFYCKAHQKILSNELLCLLNGKSMSESNYFMACSEGAAWNKNILRFANELVNVMTLDCDQNNCDTADKRCNSNEAKNVAFKASKRMFCRGKENTGEHFRFSFSRLSAIALAASGMKWDQTTIDIFEKIYFFDKFKAEEHLLSNCIISLDKDREIVTKIAESMHFISTVGGGIKNITMKHKHLNPDHQSAHITIEVTAHKAITMTEHVGTTYGSFINILADLGHQENFVTDRTVWEFQVSANRNNNDLIVSWGFQ